MEQILLVEDNEKLAQNTIRYLAQNGYKLIHRVDGEMGRDYALRNKSSLDLLVLDIRLPSISGIDLCRHLREHSLQQPIIMLTSLGDSHSIVQALNIGADDYLTKPFAFAELLARIKALLRRPARLQERELKAGGLEINLDSRTARFAGVEMTLRRKEFELLHYLLRHNNQMISREELILNIWEEEANPYHNTIDVHMRRLRQQIKQISPGSEKAIQTIYGFGYRMRL